MSAQGGSRKVSFAPTAQRAPPRPKAPIPSVAELSSLRQALWHAAIEPSTHAAYQRATRQWFIFVAALHLPPFPSSSSLSLFVAWRSRDVYASTIRSDLAGLAYHFKGIDEQRWAKECFTVDVARALKGAAKLNPHTVHQARPLQLPHLLDALRRIFAGAFSYDELLWSAMSVVAFFSCARGQEITVFDTVAYRDGRKYSIRSSVRITKLGFSAALPYHKADPEYTGSKLWFATQDAGSLVDVIRLYLVVRDCLCLVERGLPLAEGRRDGSPSALAGGGVEGEVRGGVHGPLLPIGRGNVVRFGRRVGGAD